MGAKRQEQSPDSEALRLAGQRLKKAQAAYARFAAVTPLEGSEVPVHSGRQMKEAQEELRAAEAEAKRLYTLRLRDDPEFKAASDRAEEALGKGPPWDDAFSPSDLPLSRDSRNR